MPFIKVFCLQRENESLKFQLEAYKNEVDVIKTDAQKEVDKFKAQFIARQALQGAFDNNVRLLICPCTKNTIISTLEIRIVSLYVIFISHFINFKSAKNF